MDIFLKLASDISGVSDRAFTGELLGAHLVTNPLRARTLGVESQSQGNG